MTLRDQIGDLIDVLDAHGHSNLVTNSVPCWILLDQYGGTRALIFYLRDDSGEMWAIADSYADRVHHLKRKDAEDLITGQAENSFNFDKFRQSRVRVTQ
jgi:hypothetical protein